ncbi:iron complex transport system ATP-binding protein [Austwickia chelonae]|uniref:Putative ABC transporter ATP-binding protein n=1 Tax=Austwickia chelonae NBRC 105200 TaxID=1184607 RepID=K6UNV4_9MICO|nr:ABC transporter ATP-binding protein [Austwickia chelonae]GAB79286.1 putative ABC transporter ATP-binding protein [Austwickia chelonae NBRC 105200]SEW37933.1 iron complex transport system ATP-binding protein [Austwickia chelonae]
MISANDVSVGYDDVLVLKGVGLHAGPREVVGLIGPNGSGKSTFLRTLYAALRPRAGLITIDEQPVSALRSHDLARRVAVVAQETPSDLPVTVADMVLLGRSPHRKALAAFTREDHQAVAAALTRVGARTLADRRFSTLSGGEKQRVLVARSLAQQADHLLLDEPTNHLDIRYQHELLQMVGQLEVTTVVVLHDLNLAARYCTKLVLLERGHVAAAGTPEEVLTPETLRRVYGIHVERVTVKDSLQLIFSPLDEHDAA